jgi:hypothetical protein
VAVIGVALLLVAGCGNDANDAVGEIRPHRQHIAKRRSLLANSGDPVNRLPDTPVLAVYGSDQQIIGGVKR